MDQIQAMLNTQTHTHAHQIQAMLYTHTHTYHILPLLPANKDIHLTASYSIMFFFSPTLYR